MGHARCALRVARVLIAAIAVLALGTTAWAQEMELEPQVLVEEGTRPFQRKDVPPNSIAGLLTFASQGGDSDCFVSPRDSGADCWVEIPGSLNLGLSEFGADDEVVELTIRGPDGATALRETLAFSAPQSGFGRIARKQWPALPGLAPGAYRVEARTAHHEVVRGVTVRPAKVGVPYSFVFPRAGPPGTVFTLAMTGFAPGASVPVRLYQSVACNGVRDDTQLGSSTYAYASELRPVVVDAAGSGVASISTAADDLGCSYAIETEPASARIFMSHFDVTGAAVGPTTNLWLAVVDEANRVWNSVARGDGTPVGNLDRVLGEPLRGGLRLELAELQARGLHRVIEELEPTRVLAARQLTGYAQRLPATDGFSADIGVFEVLTAERWRDQLVDGDGRVVEAHDTPLLMRYVVRLIPAAGDSGGELGQRWLIVEASSFARH